MEVPLAGGPQQGVGLRDAPSARSRLTIAIGASRTQDATPWAFRRSGLGARAHRLAVAAVAAAFGTFSALVAAADWPGTLVGSDGLRYWWAAHDYMVGLSPWDRFYNGGSYAGSPTAVLAFLPFALLPAAAFLAMWIPLVVASALYIVRRLRLPLWWMLFPPLVDAVFKLQPTVVLVAAILAGFGGIAACLKVIALPALVGELRWRALAAFAAITALSVVVAPGLWSEYVSRFGELSGRLVSELHGGLSPLAIPAAIAALTLGPRRAGWLLIPVAWPDFEYHYGIFLLPVAGPLALASALPWHEPLQVAVIGLGAWRLAVKGKARRRVSLAPHRAE